MQYIVDIIKGTEIKKYIYIQHVYEKLVYINIIVQHIKTIRKRSRYAYRNLW